MKKNKHRSKNIESRKKKTDISSLKKDRCNVCKHSKKYENAFDKIEITELFSLFS